MYMYMYVYIYIYNVIMCEDNIYILSSHIQSSLMLMFYHLALFALNLYRTQALLFDLFD